MAKVLYDWGGVDWSKQDVVISRELGCSRERVRQKRKGLGRDKSPHYHEHNSIFKAKIMKLNTSHLNLKEIVNSIKCSKVYAINLLKKLDKSYCKVDGRVGGKYSWGGVDWSMKDREVALKLGVPNVATVTQHRRRLGIFKLRRNKKFELVK